MKLLNQKKLAIVLVTTIITVTGLAASKEKGIPPQPPTVTKVFITNQVGTTLQWQYQPSSNGNCTASPVYTGNVANGSSQQYITTTNCPWTATGNFVIAGIGTVTAGSNPCQVINSNPGYYVSAQPGAGTCLITVSK